MIMIILYDNDDKCKINNKKKQTNERTNLTNHLTDDYFLRYVN